MNMKTRSGVSSTIAALFCLCSAGFAQDVPVQSPVTSPAAVQGDMASPQAPPDSSGAPTTITFQDALKLARKNNPTFLSALTDSASAHEDKVQSRATLLPNVNFTTQAIHTPLTDHNATSGASFISSNGVHEYVSQGNVHEALSLEGFGGFRRAQAAEAVARAHAEIAARGLVLTVVQSYYGFVIAQRKYATAQKLGAEGEHFLGISKKLENGGEVAHADVIRAQLQFNQQSHDLKEAQLAMDRARLDLAVLIFPDFRQNFSAVDDLQSPEPLTSLEEARSAAGHKNPQLRAALATLDMAKGDVTSAWGGFAPSVSFDYFYGIDAPRFATKTGNLNNLGYSTTATLQFPVFSWGAGLSKLKQAHLHRTQAQVELSFTQRQLLANLQTFYDEARTSREELETLQQSAELAGENLRLTTLRYQAGDATVLEVVDAQNTLALSRNAYDDGQARYRAALANLQTLTGTP